MSWDYASQIGRIVAASHILLVALLFIFRTRAWERICAISLGLGGATFLVFPLWYQPQTPRYILLPLVLLQSGASFWFWLFTLFQMRENFRPNWRHWTLLSTKFLLTIVWAAEKRDILLPIPPDQQPIWRALLPALMTIGFAIAAIVEASRRYEDDLLESRRGMRRLMIFWGGGAIATIVGITLILRGPVLNEIGNWLIIGLSLCTCVSLHFWMAQSSMEQEKSENDPEPLHSPELKQLADRIESLFRTEGYYKTEDLTVSMLAKHLREHEYKVRRAINGVLGYRNFNAFLNHSRVLEAKRRLLEEPDLPILRLAMDLGYRSLAVFNKAFKETTGRTPSSFRRAKKTD